MGIGGDGLRQIRRQFKEIGVLANALLPVFGAHAENIGDEIQVLDARHVLIQIGIVGDIGHVPLARNGLGADGLAADHDLAGVKLQDARHRLEGGGLAGAVVSDEAVDLAGLNVQAQIVYRFFLSVGLC